MGNVHCMPAAHVQYFRQGAEGLYLQIEFSNKTFALYIAGYLLGIHF